MPIRSKVRGDVATRYREDDKQIEILVRADESQRNTIESIQNLLDQCSARRNTGQRKPHNPSACRDSAGTERSAANSRPATSSSVPADRPAGSHNGAREACRFGSVRSRMFPLDAVQAKCAAFVRSALRWCRRIFPAAI